MTSTPFHISADFAETPPLLHALEKSDEVREKIADCALDLSIINKLLVPANDVEESAHERLHIALSRNEDVEEKVQECAAELEEVSDALSEGIDERAHLERTLVATQAALNATRQALANSQDALSDTQEALIVTQQEERKANQRALHDGATGLPNRELFDDRLSHALVLAQRNRWSLAVMFLDLNQFKAINDNHGHEMGDIVLQEVAQRLTASVRGEDTVCRNGGDEFLYLMINPSCNDDVRRVADVLHDVIAQPISANGMTLQISASIGIAVYPQDGEEDKELIRHADAAMYRAKNSGVRQAWFASIRSPTASY